MAMWYSLKFFDEQYNKVETKDTYCRELAVSMCGRTTFSSVAIDVWPRSKPIKNYETKLENLAEFLTTINIKSAVKDGELMLLDKYEIEVSLALLLLRNYIDHFYRKTDLEEFSRFLIRKDYRTKIGDLENIIRLIFFMYYRSKTSYRVLRTLYNENGPISWTFMNLRKLQEYNPMLMGKFADFIISIIDDRNRLNTLYSYDLEFIKLRLGFKNMGLDWY